MKPTAAAILPVSFYARPARQVAVDLLGKRLVRLIDGARISGIIAETEAYCDSEEPDLACHGDRANKGQPTKRTAVMFGPAGYAYVYFTYGMHWMFNIVTGHEKQANAVLIRALQPDEGIDFMQMQRARPRAELTNGPAKLAQALAIDQRFNGAKLYDPRGELWLEPAVDVSSAKVKRGPRIGLGKTPEPWYSIPWRYWIDGHPDVSCRSS